MGNLIKQSYLSGGQLELLTTSRVGDFDLVSEVIIYGSIVRQHR
jgi:hypothetical protein